MEKPYYVYQLIDPRNEHVFYIGKGQGRRAWAHEKRVRNGDLLCNPAKSRLINDIISSGQSVAISIVEHFDREKDALLFEAALIKAGQDLTNGPAIYLTDDDRERAVARRNALTAMARIDYQQRRIKSFGLYRARDREVVSFVNRLSRDWARSPSGERPTKYRLPRWIRNARAVTITQGEYSGHVGTIVSIVDKNSAKVLILGDVTVDCQISWLRRMPRH